MPPRPEAISPIASIRSSWHPKDGLDSGLYSWSRSERKRASRQVTRILILAIIRRVLLRAIAVQSGRVNGFPSFAQDEGSESKRSYRVSPRLMPDGVHHESRESNPSHVTTEGRFRSIGLQSCTRCDDCQLSFPVRQPRHHHEACQCKKQASCDSGCPRLAQREAKTPEHDGCRKQFNQTVSAESQQRGAVRSPSRPERNDGLHTHPDKGDDLELKNSARDVRQGRCCRCGHKMVAIILTPQSQARELLGNVEWVVDARPNWSLLFAAEFCDCSAECRAISGIGRSRSESRSAYRIDAGDTDAGGLSTIRNRCPGCRSLT